MDKDFSELTEYLGQKFDKIDERFNKFDERFDELPKIFATKQDVNGLRESVQALTISVDRLVGAVSDLKTEYAAITNQINRHEKWFHIMAEKLGIKLEY